MKRITRDDTEHGVEYYRADEVDLLLAEQPAQQPRSDYRDWDYQDLQDEQPAQQEPVGCEGAVVNGRVYADRLEHDYKFECEAGPLHLCTDWVEFRRCFEWLAQHTSPPAQRTWVGLTAVDRKEIERQSVYVEGAIRLTEAKLKEKNA